MAGGGFDAAVVDDLTDELGAPTGWDGAGTGAAMEGCDAGEVVEVVRAVGVLRFCRVENKSVAITTQMTAVTQNQGIAAEGRRRYSFLGGRT